MVTWPTVVIDPPWQYADTTIRTAAENHYDTMTLDDLAAIDIPADDHNAHLYLWVTNPFLRQGFDLLDAWGFDYKTTLTWIKPQIGLGRYFRGCTEHVLFANRGRLGINTKNTRNVFTANRTRHSAKPDAFYDLVQANSPHPWLEMFSRTRRLGWDGWGHEA